MGIGRFEIPHGRESGQETCVKFSDGEDVNVYE
jgi:hypothetical protein